MIFNSFAFANDYSFGANDRTAVAVTFSCRQIRLEGICLALRENFFKRGCEFFLYLLNHSLKKIINFSFKLIYVQVN